MEEAVLLHPSGFAVEDSMLNGFGGRTTGWAEGGQIFVEPGGVSGKVAFAGPHLMDAAGKKLGEAHEGMGRKGGMVRISWWRGSERAPMW